MVTTWEEYKKHVKDTDPIIGKDIEEIERVVEIIAAIVNKRNELGISQRDLAEMCELPHSSVARIEAFRVVPKIDTLLKIMMPLGLTLSVSNI